MGSFISSVSGLLGSAIDSLGNPINYSFLSGIWDWLCNLGPAIVNGIMWLIYLIMRFILNIVDFMQYFVKKLVGLDYWGTDAVSIDTLGESDVIFRFLYNSTVQRVFKYMLGIFAILLIVFTIIAIVKSEYAYVTDETGKVNNDKMTIFKRAFKAIALVVLFPIMIVMGILASNAILTSLVNAFNINNKLTMGSQIFTASAYGANKYRLYADNNIRLPATNNVAVTITDDDGNEVTKYISAAVTTITPRDYTSKHKFYGFMFTYNAKNFLYYVPQSELDENYKFYVKYFEEILKVTLVRPQDVFLNPYKNNLEYAFCESLHAKDGSEAINVAAYNTWYYNELLTKDTLTFDKTVTATPRDFIADSGNQYYANLYTNNEVWGALHDGGTTGLVAIPDEYYVMADVIDFMINDVVEMAIVNVNNPLINWSYSGENGYIDTRFIHHTSGGSLDSFMVNYTNSGYTLYKPNMSASEEEQGAIYIMAYYNTASNRYIPVVNNMAYVDDYGDEHTFTSSYLDPNYKGIIVARGVLQTTFSNRVGQPTQIKTGYVKDSSGNLVAEDDPYYVQVNAEEYQSYARKVVDYSVSFNTNYVGLDGNKLVEQYAGGVDGLSSSSGYHNTKLLDELAYSLPYGFSYTSINNNNEVVNETLSNITWSYSGTNNVVNLNLDGTAKDYLVFKSNKKITVKIENDQFTSSDSVPLYCFVNVTSDGKANMYFAYSQYSGSGTTWFTSGVPNTPVVGGGNFSLDSIHGGYSLATSVTSNSDGLMARLLSVRGSADFSENGDGICAYINSSSLTFRAEKVILDTTGNVFSVSDISISLTNSGYSEIVMSIKKILPDIDGTMISNLTKSEVDTDTVKEITGGYYHVVSSTKYSDGSKDNYYALYNSDGSVYQEKYGNASHPLIVKVSFDATDNSVSLMALDLFNVYLVEKDNGGTPIEVGDAKLLVNIYDMEYVGTSGEEVTYRYQYGTNQYLYYNFKIESQGNGTEGLYNVNNGTNYDMYKLTFNYYNLFAFKVGDGEAAVCYQYDPNKTGDDAFLKNNLTLINSQSYYVRPSSISFSRQKNDIYTGVIYRENSSSVTSQGSIIASVYSSSDTDPNSDLAAAVSNSYLFAMTSGTYGCLPAYDSLDMAKKILTTIEPNIQFEREYFDMGELRFDFSLNVLNMFGEGATWRFKLGFFSGVSDSQKETLSFTITKGRLYLDYNFNSTAHMSVQTFYVPGEINPLILVFATILVLIVLGQAVWGLVARIYDITIYFLVMPGIVSTLPFDDSRYSKWKSNLISKILGAYGVMIGLNFFFILIPAIRSASQLFTDYDLKNNISQGSWLSFLSADAVNNLVYILFLLVAFTLIKTLPKTIADLIGAEDAYSNGAKVKGNVDKAVTEVGKHVSGKAAMDAVKGIPKTLKNFVPGSAIYDEWKKKHPGKGKDGGKKEQEAMNRGIEAARGQAESKMNAGNSKMGGDKPAQETNSDKTNKTTTTQGTTTQETNSDKTNKTTTTQGTTTQETNSDKTSKTTTTQETTTQETKDTQAENQNQIVVPPVVSDETEPANNSFEMTKADQNAYDAIEQRMNSIEQRMNGVDEKLEASELTQGENDSNMATKQGLEAARDVYDKAINDGYDSLTDEEKSFIDSTGERQNKIDEIIKNNAVEGLDAETSIDYYDEAIKERARLESEIQAEKDKRTGWINAAVAAGLAEEGTDDFVLAKDGKMHEQGVPYKAELDASTENMKNLEKQLSELPTQEEAEAKQEALLGALVDQDDLVDDIAERGNELGKEEIVEEAKEETQDAVVAEAEHAKSADTATEAENTDESALKEVQDAAASAQNFAEAAQNFAEASKIYADITGNRIAPIYEKKEKKEKDTRTRDQKKLDKLTEIRDTRLQRQEEGKSRTFLKTYHNRKKAYNEFNKDKELKDQIISKSNEQVRKLAIEKFNAAQANEKDKIKDIDKVTERDKYLKAAINNYNKSHGLTGESAVTMKQVAKDATVESLAKENGIMSEVISEYDNYQEGRKDEAVDTYMQDIKDELAVKAWNEKYKNDPKSQIADVETMRNNSYLRDRVRDEFKTDQEVKKTVARNDFINSKIDKKIAKQEEKMSLKEQGLYESKLHKVMMAPLRAVRHKVTDEERVKLQGKKDVAEKNLEEKRRELENFTGSDKEKAIKEKAVKAAENKVATLNAAIASEYRGLVPKVARELANGGRAVRSKWYNNRANKAEKKAENYNPQAEHDKKYKSSAHSDTQTFTDHQIKVLDRKLASVNATQTQLDRFKLSNKNLFDKDGNADFDAAKKKIDADLEKEMRRSNPDGNKEDADLIKAQFADRYEKLKENEAKYNELLARKNKAEIDYKKQKQNYNFANRDSYTSYENSLQRKQLRAAKKAKRAVVDQMNEKRRKGILTDAEEAKMIKDIQGRDKVIEDLKNVPPRFKKLASAKAGTVYAAMKGKQYAIAFGQGVATRAKAFGQGVVNAAKTVGHGVATGATIVGKGLYTVGNTVAKYTGVRAIYRKGKRVKAAKNFLAKDEMVQARKEQIAEREAQAKIDRENTAANKRAVRARGAQIKVEANDKAFIDAVQKALSKSGYAGQVSTIKTRSDAEKAVNAAIAKLTSDKTELTRKIAETVQNGGSGAVETAAKQRKERDAINKALRQLKSVQGGINITGGNVNVTGSARVNTNANVKATGNVEASGQTRIAGTSDRSKIRTSLDRSSVEAAIRSTYLKEYNDIIKKDMARGFKPDKTAAKAFTNSESYKKVLNEAKKDLTRKIKSGAIPVGSKAESKVKDDLKKVESQLAQLKALQDKTESRAKKLNKQVSELMSDRRSKKYTTNIPKVQNTTNTDPNGK